MEVLPLYPKLDTPGLFNSTLYDVIPIIEGAADEVTVNASQIQVECGVLPNGSISGFLSFDDGVTPDKFTNISVGNSALDVLQMAIGMLLSYFLSALFLQLRFLQQIRL